MSNLYNEMRERHQAEVNAFPIAFAFSNEQFKRGMRSLGLDPSETDKVYSLGGTGGFYRRRDAPVFHEMLDRHERERQEAIAADKTGNGYIYDMFSHELANHEYGYAHDAEDALEALGLTMEEIEKSPIMLRAFGRAKKAQFADPF